MGKSSKRSHRQQVNQVAREQFGYESLRGGQEAAIKSIAVLFTPPGAKELVMRYEGDKMVILFDEVGYKTLGVDFVRRRGLLKPTE